MLLSAEALAASKSRLVQEGNELFEEENYEQSSRKYSQGLEKDPESDIMNYNMGTALYKEKKLYESGGALSKVIA